MRLLRLLIALLLMTGTACLNRRSDKPDIFLIIIDTLRADHLGCYGYHRDTSPVLDSLAASGTVFTRAQAQAPWTLPACASIWTGLTARSHQAGRRDGVIFGLSDELANIGTVLEEQGYITLGFINAYILSGCIGFGNGFDHYSCAMIGHGRAAETIDEVMDWLYENRGNPNPKLTVIHLFDVHAPYDPPGGFDTLFCAQGTQGITEWQEDSLSGALITVDRDHLVDMYDGEIAWVDCQLGRLFAELRSSGVADHAYIIVIADHGEEFLDHGLISHGHSLYQEILHVPLIVSGPGIPAGVRDSVPCGQIDILPTIAGFAGAPVPKGVEGVDLFQVHPSQRALPSSGVIRGHFQPGMDVDYEQICSVINWPYKAITNFATMQDALYDLDTDPGELAPMEMDSALQGELEYYWAAPPMATAPVVSDDAVEDNLQDLGYIR